MNKNLQYIVHNKNRQKNSKKKFYFLGVAREFRAWPRQNGRGLISEKNKYIMSTRFISKSTKKTIKMSCI